MAFVKFAAATEDVSKVIGYLKLPDASIAERKASKIAGREVVTLENRYEGLPSGMSQRLYIVEKRDGIAKILDYTGK